MSVLVLDAGNSIIKAKISRRERGEIAFLHALRQLTENEYQKIISRISTKGRNKDYVRVNGVPYVVGESAERHGVLTQRSGTARYTRDYYGVLAAISLARLYGRGREAAVFGSHPPGDVKFREDLMKSAIGEWEVEIGGNKANYRVIYANTFDEPVGGLMNVLLTEDGQHYQYPNIGAGRSLVIDIGGFTTDWLAVNPGGEVDYSLARSVPMGIQEVITSFEESFRSNNLELVKDTPVLPPARVRRAIATGVFEGGGKIYPCSQAVEEATSLFLNRIANTYQQVAGGALSWDNIILTGGGSAVQGNPEYFQLEFDQTADDFIGQQDAISDKGDVMSLRFGLLNHGQDVGVGERFPISAKENSGFWRAGLKSGQDALEGCFVHESIFHIPDIAHADGAVQVAFVGHFNIDPVQRRNWREGF